MKNKKILILGSSGFLGSYLVKFLLVNNEVVQFDVNPPLSQDYRFGDYKRANLY